MEELCLRSSICKAKLTPIPNFSIAGNGRLHSAWRNLPKYFIRRCYLLLFVFSLSPYSTPASHHSADEARSPSIRDSRSRSTQEPFLGTIQNTTSHPSHQLYLPSRCTIDPPNPHDIPATQRSQPCQKLLCLPRRHHSASSR
jgi:hypothetical protein